MNNTLVRLSILNFFFLYVLILKKQLSNIYMKVQRNWYFIPDLTFLEPINMTAPSEYIEKELPIDDNLGEDSEEIIPFKYSITSYGADYPVDSLVKRISDKSIIIPAFQRGFVWSLKQSSRFVESLLLGLPVPGIFLAKEKETQKLLVIDGQQRLRTLEYFYNGIFANTGREFCLKGVQSVFDGATYKSINDEDRRRLDDSILHATVVKQDEPSDDDSSIYHVFERLNTGGNLLRPQEVRACIYHGEFNEVIKKLNKNESWRSIYGPVSIRMIDQELILRFLALYFNFDNYTKPMKEFLNAFMGKNRHLEKFTAGLITNVFVKTIEIVSKYLGSNAFKPKKILKAAIYDAVMVGIAKRLQKGEINDCASLISEHYCPINHEKKSLNHRFVLQCVQQKAIDNKGGSGYGTL